MGQKELEDLKLNLKSRVESDKIRSVLSDLKQILPKSATAKFNTLVLLGHDFNKLESIKIKNTLTPEIYSIKQASFLDNLLNFIDGLDLSDFESEAANANLAEGGIKNKTGSVLYRIPPKMEIGKEEKCLVRLSFDESYLLDNINIGDDLHIKSIRRIHERMEVELVDPNENKTFQVRSLSSPIQKVEKDDYTEWLYFIKPLKEGTYDLWLKVMVIIIENEERIKKDIVLQEQIEVVTTLDQEIEEGLVLKRAGMVFTFGLPSTGSGAAGSGDKGDAATAALAGATAGASGGLLGTLTAKLMAVAASILIIAGVLHFGFGIFGFGNVSDLSSTEEVLSGEDTTQNNLLGAVSPLDFISNRKEVFVWKAGKDTTIVTASGSSYNFPADALVGQDGNPVQGEVEIEIEEIFTPQEIISSGIPMRFFDEAMKERWFQTAGMFNIHATQNGQPVEVADGNRINVKLVSNVPGAYDFWKFNQEIGNWEYKEKGTDPKQITIMDPLLSKELKALRSATAKKPSPPVFYRTIRYETESIDLSCCPELNPDDNDFIYLSFAGKNSDIAPENNAWVQERNWLRRTMEKSNLGPNVYKLTWEGDTTFHTYLRPALEDKDMARSKARYDSLSNEYEKNLVLLREKEALIEEQYAFVRSVQVSEFGIYNYDVFWDEKDILSLKIDFDLGNQYNPLKEIATAYLITADRQSVIKYPKQTWHKFQYSPSADNQLVFVLPNQKMAIFNQNDFDTAEADIETASARNKVYQFKMKIIDRPGNSIEDLGKILNNTESI